MLDVSSSLIQDSVFIDNYSLNNVLSNFGSSITITSVTRARTAAIVRNCSFSGGNGFLVGTSLNDRCAAGGMVQCRDQKTCVAKYEDCPIGYGAIAVADTKMCSKDLPLLCSDKERTCVTKKESCPLYPERYTVIGSTRMYLVI